MEDSEVIHRISQLVDEEHQLLERGEREDLSEAEHQRLRALEVSLDQLWDYLRQRRARRAAGLDPDDAQIRDPKIVEGYQQ